MATASSHVRSVSTPSRSHPTTLNIEEQLCKLRTTWDCSPNAEAVSKALCGLVELYQSMDGLLSLPQSFLAISNHQNSKWVDELLEGPVKLLDICGATRDIVSQFQENIRDVQSSLRRRKGDLSIEASITKYITSQKKMKKDGKRLISSLKQMNQAIEGSTLEVSTVIRTLREVNAVSISIFQYLLAFLSASSDSKSSKGSKWSFSKLMHRGTTAVACESQQQNLDSATLRNVCKNGSFDEDKIQFVQQKLETMEGVFQGIEKGLEGICRCLIRSRTSLLNIVSC